MTTFKSLWSLRYWIFPLLFFGIASAFIGGVVVGEQFSPIFHLNRITQFGVTEFSRAYEDETMSHSDCVNDSLKIYIIHTVRVGDTLYSIARQYGTAVPLLKFVNCIPEDNHIFVDQALLIPKDVSI